MPDHTTPVTKWLLCINKIKIGQLKIGQHLIYQDEMHDKYGNILNILHENKKWTKFI